MFSYTAPLMRTKWVRVRMIRLVPTLATLARGPTSRKFSATFSNDIKALADDLLNDPTLIEVDPSNTAADQVTQRVIQVDRERRRVDPVRPRCDTRPADSASRNAGSTRD
mgnify:CR=1 FL=1